MTALQSTLPLALPETHSFAEWSDLGRVLLTAKRKVDWLIGDWLIAGAERYGEKARADANRIFLTDVERFDPILKTCRRFPEEKRHAALTFGHHQAVMTVEDDVAAERLLADAERDRMTVSAVKAQVRVLSDRQPRMIEDDDPEDTAYRRIVQAWNIASRASRQAFLESAQESDMGVIEL